MPFRLIPRLGCFGVLVFALLVPVVLTAILAPWAYHIGGRSTPGSWWGYGTLSTVAGEEYPVFIYFFPDFRGRPRLRLNGQRPTSSLRGMGWLCSAQGVTQRLDLSGVIYGSYLNTDGNQVYIRLLDARQPFRISPQPRRYADFYGRWQGPELVMQDNGSWERNFHLDPQNPKSRANVTFKWGGYSGFKNVCKSTVIPEKARIPPPRN